MIQKIVPPSQGGASGGWACSNWGGSIWRCGGGASSAGSSPPPKSRDISPISSHSIMNMKVDNARKRNPSNCASRNVPPSGMRKAMAATTSSRPRA